jgi:2,4-dienoyl-CoA reductase (NADPH2)
MGAGGIGFDVAELITHAGPSARWTSTPSPRMGHRLQEPPARRCDRRAAAGGQGDREVILMQRKADALGKTLGRTTGWTHRLTLNRRGVQMVGGVDYLKIDDAGLHTRSTASRGCSRWTP